MPHTITRQSVMQAVHSSLLLTLSLVMGCVLWASDPTYEPDAASHLGSDGNEEAVLGAAIASDGTVILAARIGSVDPGGVTAILLDDASATSPGAVIRLSKDGRTVLSVTRFSEDVWDLSLGPDDSIYIACGAGGAVKLNAESDTLIWKLNDRANRLDVGTDGTVAILDAPFSSHRALNGNDATVRVHNASGTALGSFSVLGSGHRTLDIAIDADGQRVYTTGYRQYTQVPQLQMPFVLASGYTGTQVWKAYDFTYQAASDASRMADTRGQRLVVANNRLYVGFRTDGGNHLVTNPFSPAIQVPFTSVDDDVAFHGGGTYSNFANAQGASSLFVLGIYDLATAAWQGGAVACTRIADESSSAYGKLNAYHISEWGDLAVDEDGRVAFLGSAASGGGTNNSLLGLPYSWNPIQGNQEYGGGPSLTILSPSLNERLACIRLSSQGGGAALAMRQIGNATAPNLAWGGRWSPKETSLHISTVEPIQPDPGGGQDGWFAVINNADIFLRQIRIVNQSGRKWSINPGPGDGETMGDESVFDGLPIGTDQLLSPVLDEDG